MSEMCISSYRSSCEHYYHSEPESRGRPELLNTWITTELAFLHHSPKGFGLTGCGDGGRG